MKDNSFQDVLPLLLPPPPPASRLPAATNLPEKTFLAELMDEDVLGFTEDENCLFQQHLLHNQQATVEPLLSSHRLRSVA